jgi:small subunit ribosomal protein S15
MPPRDRGGGEKKGTKRDFMSATKEERRQMREKHARSPADCGSPEVQAALMSQRIRDLTEHLHKHKKDHASRRGLLMLVGKRSKLLKYLAKVDVGRYQKLIESLGLRR